MTLMSMISMKRRMEYVKPQGEIEAEVAEVIREVTGIKLVGAEDSLISMGVSSLKAIGLQMEIEDTFSVSISAAEILQIDTVRGISEEIRNYKTKRLVTRNEESLFDFDSTQAQVVIGVRRSGKSTLCHKVLTERKVEYAYVNLDDDRLANLQTEDLNTVLSCVMFCIRVWCV